MYRDHERFAQFFGDEFSYLTNSYASMLILCHKYKYDFAKLMNYNNLSPLGNNVFNDYSYEDTLFEDINNYIKDFSSFFSEASGCFIVSFDTTFEEGEGEYTGDFGDYTTVTFNPIINIDNIMDKSIYYVRHIKNSYTKMRYLEDSISFEIPIVVDAVESELKAIKDYFIYLFKGGLLHNEIKH